VEEEKFPKNVLHSSPHRRREGGTTYERRTCIQSVMDDRGLEDGTRKNRLLWETGDDKSI
jgi:hypothetical protein